MRKKRTKICSYRTSYGAERYAVALREAFPDLRFEVHAYPYGFAFSVYVYKLIDGKWCGYGWAAKCARRNIASAVSDAVIPAQTCGNTQ